MPKHRVLIADASPTFRAILRTEFDPERFEIIEAADGHDALEKAVRFKPAIATLSIVLPKRDGIHVCAAITRNEALVRTTVIMITSSGSELDRAHAFEAGAVRFLGKDFPKGALAAYIEDILAPRDPLVDTNILILDDNPVTAAMLAKLLRAEAATVFQAADGHQGLDLLRKRSVDVIITDYYMPNMDGVTFVRAVRNMRQFASTPVLFVSVSRDRTVIVRALEAGANDFIVKPFEATELLARLRSFARLVTLTKELKSQAATDELTGLANRREGLARLDECIATADRYNTPFSCIMVDIDHFKRLNDTHGHAAGDFALKETARILRENVRTSDTVSRLGGEEFLILCPHTRIEQAVACAEKLRASIERHTCVYRDTAIKMTISSGVAWHGHGRTDADAILRRSDDALYNAKRAGRNRVARDNTEPPDTPAPTTLATAASPVPPPDPAGRHAVVEKPLNRR